MHCNVSSTFRKHIATNFHSNSIWAPSSEFVSSSIPSWQILTAHAQPFRGARDLVFCLKVPLDSLLVWASIEGSGETARMRRLAWTFAARIGVKYQIRLTRSICMYATAFQVIQEENYKSDIILINIYLHTSLVYLYIVDDFESPHLEITHSFCQTEQVKRFIAL